MSAEGSVGLLDQFSDQVKYIVDKAWSPNWGVFSSQWPTDNNPNEIRLPQITYELYHRVPSKSMRTIKPKNMGSYPDPAVPGGIIWQFSQWFDCLVDFGIWHKTNHEAEILKDQFEEAMLIYAGYFKQQGISEILFIAEMTPSVSTKWRQDIPHRALRYFVRIERITLVRSDTLQKITTEVDVHGTGAITQTIPSSEATQFLSLYQKSVKPGPSTK